MINSHLCFLIYPFTCMYVSITISVSHLYILYIKYFDCSIESTSLSTYFSFVSECYCSDDEIRVSFICCHVLNSKWR